VEPGFTALRRALQACGFDLSTTLITFARDPERDARVRGVQRLTPQDRMRGMVDRVEQE
jgi:hypothetical protein